MSKVDILRVVERIPELFAPAIFDGQGFIAYFDEETNSFTVQGDNIFTSISNDDVERISASVARLAAQIDNVQDGCSDIPTIKTQIQSLQSNTATLRSDVTALQSSSGGASSGGSSGGGNHYVVDCIVDVVTSLTQGASLPTEIKVIGKSFINLDEYGVYLCYVVSTSGSYPYNVIQNPYLDEGFSFAAIQSSLSNNAGIYRVIEAGQSVEVSHNIQDGDMIYSKADGCTYLFSNNGTAKSFIKIHSPVIASVLDILPIGRSDNNYDYLGAGKQYIGFESYNGYWTLYKSIAGDDWDTESNLQIGDRYVSTIDHKIYECKKSEKSNNMIVFSIDIPVNCPFLNKADGCLYVFDGTNFINVGYNAPAVIAPVLDVLPVVRSLPSRPSAIGDKCVVDNYSYDDVYIYTATNADNWNNCEERIVVDGERYASTTNNKIYEFKRYQNYSSYTPPIISDVPVGYPFFNKADSSLYVFDGTQFIKT